MARIAMFSTYAPSEGFGGPARVFHQRRVLEGAGHDVTHVVIQATAGRGDTRSSDLVKLCERPFADPIDHIYNDVDLAERAVRDQRLVERVIDHLATTDVIILEQPFLVGLVRAAADRLRIPVVYSSQNIEYRLRRDLERFQPDRRRPRHRSDDVRALEVEAVEISAAVTAICPHDQQQMADEFGCAPTLVPNGSSIIDVTLPNPARAGRPSPYFAFAGSSYWPNVEGFSQIATPSLAMLPPTVKIQVAGTAGPELLQHPAIRRHESINASRIEARGFLSMEKLVGMMYASTAVLVPVFVGEGSNLKSADALASGAPVIMTERATRGYEDVLDIDDEGVVVVESPVGFRAAMAESLRHPRAHTAVGTVRRDVLGWNTRLAPLVEVVGRLL